MWVLLGIAAIVAGFMLRFNPLAVIMASAAVTGLAAGLDLHDIISAFGKAFNDARYVSIVWIVLPVIGKLEAFGLQERARGLIATLKGRYSRALAGGLSFVAASYIGDRTYFGRGASANCTAVGRTNGRGRCRIAGRRVDPTGTGKGEGFCSGDR